MTKKTITFNATCAAFSGVSGVTYGSGRYATIRKADGTSHTLPRGLLGPVSGWTSFKMADILAKRGGAS